MLSWSFDVYFIIWLSAFLKEKPKKKFFLILKNNFDTEELKKVSDNYKNFVKWLLNPKKENRIKTFESLKHPFFTEKLNPYKIMSQNKYFSILKKFWN